MDSFALHRYTPEQLYNVVTNVDQYQQFVPWCTKSRVIKGKSCDFQAELEIGFPPIVERYTSEVTIIPNHKVRVSLCKTVFSTQFIHRSVEWRVVSESGEAWGFWLLLGHLCNWTVSLLKQAVCTNGSLFRQLETIWRFSAGASDLQPSCKVHFYVRVQTETKICCYCDNIRRL